MSVVHKQSESNNSERVTPTSLLPWCFGFFVVSGFCGLVYEVVWVRLAMASFGVTTALVSIVISMFMAGLGLGSWGAGVLTRRVLRISAQRAFRFYSMAELVVGISSIAVPFQLKLGRVLLQHMGSFGTWQTSRYYIVAGIWIAITLVPWCTCMGSTFPLLMAVIRQSARPGSERSFSYLYVANVLGALIGTIASACILIELVGFQGTLYVAGSLNAILALLAFWISYSVVSSPFVEKPVAAQARLQKLYGLPRGSILFLLFTTGLVSMGMEIVWIRQFTPYLGNVVYAFAGILAVYLLATVFGSRDYRAKAQSHPPDESAPAWSMLALFAVIPVAVADPWLRLGGAETGGLRLLSITLFCSLAGFLTPLLVDSWSSGDPDRAGTAYAVNISGSIVGPLVAGFWLLPWLGARWAAVALSIPLFVIAALAVLRKPSSQSAKPKSGTNPKLQFAIVTIIAILIIGFSHDYETIYAKRVVLRDYTATVVATGEGLGRRLLVNGVDMTNLNPITKFMVHLPLALRQRPAQNGLVICFGMGTSFRSMLSWGIPTTAVDLIPSVPKLFWYYHADAPQWVSSPLARIVIDDGRRFLDGSSQTYDVIVVDPPPPPQAAGSSLLYSREFYDVVKRHLSADGIFQTWYPENEGDSATTVSVTKALMQSFPYIRAYRSYDQAGILFMASMQPLPVASSSVLAGRLPSAAASDFVEFGPQSNPQQQFDLILPHELTLDKLVAEDPRAPAMRDDQPINEYYLLRRWLHLYR
jgi:spermidine synthase